MAVLTEIEQQVLKVTADEAEILEQIYLTFRAQPNPVPLSSIADAVRSLVEKGLLATQSDVRDAGAAASTGDASYVWKARFTPTPEGRQAREAPPADAGPTTRPRRETLYGAWKDLGVPPITAEEIAEARREMWGNFPRDFPE